MRFLFVLVVTMLSCSKHNEPVFSEKYLWHKNGLKVAYPLGFEKTVIDKGFILDEVCECRRHKQIIIELSTKPSVSEEKARKVNNELVYYTVEKSEGGSGGQEYTLTANKMMGDKWMVLVSMLQSEMGEPSFDLAWEIIRRSGVR